MNFMRFAIAIILFGASISSFLSAFTWRSDVEYPAWNHSLIPYDVPTVPADFDREITFLTKHDGYDTDDGPSTYLRFHELGWNDSLQCFYQDARFENKRLWNVPEDDVWAPETSIQLPPHEIVPYCAGWRRCVEQVEDRLESDTPDVLRRNLVIPQKPYIISLVGLGTILLVLAVFVAATKSNINGTEPNGAPEPSKTH